ncbi:penicillin-binding protein activator [Acidocella sp.]|uniref:penicillin-binding protein activator n=1 Tax=Acidocella sp. TaxID=50710 RepID=UPI00262895DB|nr:penicillin-binding protein activator [Acidocella sp.]
MSVVGSRWSRSSWLLLSATLALSACAGQAPQMPVASGPAALLPAGAQAGAGSYGHTGGNVLLLAPLSGPYAGIGQALANAARLAFPASGGVRLDVRDTGGTAGGAVAAAQAGIAAGDGVIIGPLTSAETQAVAPVAKQAGVNMLPFTNDGTVAAPGVWPLGITPTQQVARVVQAAAAGGHTQLAALLSDDDFGHHLASALAAAAAKQGEPAPQIIYYQPGFAGVNSAVEQISDFAERGQGLMDEIKAAREEGTAAGRAKAAALSHQPVPPPSFNALFIGATDAATLAEMANFLPYYDVNPPQVQFLGPTLWSGLAPQMASQTVFIGALYAAPDPASAQAFDAKYQSVYGAPPPAIADVAFDAAAIARVAAGRGGYTSTVLTNPAGFDGADGLVVLNPDGTVSRGLAVFAVAPGQPVMNAPAPSSLSQPVN